MRGSSMSSWDTVIEHHGQRESPPGKSLSLTALYCYVYETRYLQQLPYCVHVVPNRSSEPNFRPNKTRYHPEREPRRIQSTGKACCRCQYTWPRDSTIHIICIHIYIRRSISYYPTWAICWSLRKAIYCGLRYRHAWCIHHQYPVVGR